MRKIFFSLVSLLSFHIAEATDQYTNTEYACPPTSYISCAPSSNLSFPDGWSIPVDPNINNRQSTSLGNIVSSVQITDTSSSGLASHPITLTCNYSKCGKYSRVVREGQCVQNAQRTGATCTSRKSTLYYSCPSAQSVACSAAYDANGWTATPTSRVNNSLDPFNSVATPAGGGLMNLKCAYTACGALGTQVSADSCTFISSLQKFSCEKDY